MFSSGGDDLIGLPVIRKGASLPSSPCVHDAWEQVVGETLVFPALLDVFRQDPAQGDGGQKAWLNDVAATCSSWLASEGRLVDRTTSHPFHTAKAVRINSAEVIIAVQ